MLRASLAAPLLLGLAACASKDEFDTGEPAASEPSETADSGALDTAEHDTADTADTAPEVTDWESFTADREDALGALSEPILACVAMFDTSNPVFHGCIDWHSAVHGTWALLTLSRLLGDDTYAAVAEAQLDPDGLAEELAAMQEGRLETEVPYGFAWMLVLARERARAGHDDLDDLADEAAAQLADYLFSLPDRQVSAGVLSQDYSNLSWAALNLWIYAEEAGDEETLEELDAFIEEEMMPLGVECPLSAESDTRNFFPPCLHLARLVALTQPEDEALAWLEDGVYDGALELEPITRPSNAHMAGLNWSRTWGLYTLWQLTGEDALRDATIEHFETHLEMPEYWAETYAAYSHWVAQFGVYALAITYEERPAL